MPRIVRLLLLACAVLAASPAAGQIEGSYTMVRINAQALPAASPLNPGTTVLRASFVFGADGRVTMATHAIRNGQAVSDSGSGLWTLAGDSLRLMDGDGGRGRTDFRWSRRADTLVLSGPQGIEITLAPSPAPSGQRLEGSYRLERINGAPVPAPSPAERNVIIHALALEMRADGRYTMRIEVHNSRTGTPIARELEGRYVVEGDRMRLEPDDCYEADDAEFRWTLDGPTLLLVDEFDEEFTFARQ